MPQKKTLTLEEAAALLGIEPGALLASRGRGLPPGRDGYKKAGVLVWDRKDLKPYLPAKSEPGIVKEDGEE